MRKFSVFVFSLLLGCMQIKAQSQTAFQNTQKYWWYRYVLVNDFMKIGNKCGESIPASERFTKHAYNWNNGYNWYNNGQFRYSGRLSML